MRKLLIACLCISAGICANSQSFYFPSYMYEDSASMTKYMPRLADSVLAIYSHPDLTTYLDNRFRFELVAEKYNKSVETLDSLLKIMGADKNEAVEAVGVHYRAYAYTMLRNPTSQVFEENFIKVLKSIYNSLPEKAAARVPAYFEVDIVPIGKQLGGLMEKISGKDSISREDAYTLCRIYNSYNVFDKVLEPARKTLATIQNNLFIIEDSVRIKTKDGATIAATIIRKKEITTPQPAVFVFNIYTGPFDRQIAREAAIHGYVGIVANTRGKRLSPEEIEPFEYDSRDAYDIIDWISKQPWCNGKIGMYGGSYLGFTQWATARKLHPALKTIVPQVAVGIGIDYPMQNNVFVAYMLRWIHYVTNNKMSDTEDFSDFERWTSLYKKWYASGASFRSLDTLDGRPSKIFQRWLQHPSHDSYWQNMVAYGKDFANINIPVLTITGYFDDDQLGAMYYFKQHYLYNKNANHYLLIGPYSHYGAQGQPTTYVNGYEVDSAALINITDITYKWFDHIMKDSTRPTILKDKINMQVMGANIWRHTSLDKISNDTLTFYLNNIYTGTHYKLQAKKPVENEFIRQEINFQDRGDTTDPSESLITEELPSMGHLVFVSDPLEAPLTISGSFIGQIKAAINKKDFDFVIGVYEQMPDGKYFALSTAIVRASYAKDRSKRTLLRPAVTETIPVNNTFFTNKQLQKGSRIVLQVGVNKNYNWQVNYGTGKDVSDETIADGKEPLQIKWFNQSFIKIPVWK
jgi:putative CocE/NonD family hydrolase